MEINSRLPFFEQISETSARSPDIEAFLFDGGALTYGDLPKVIEHYEICLLQAGVRPYTTVGVRIVEDLPHMLVALALLKMRCNQATFASTESESHHKSFGRRLNVATVLSMNSRADPLLPAHEDFETFHLEHKQAEPVQGFHPIIYLTTSGTTKEARIIPLSEQNLAANGVQWRALPGHRTLWLPSVEQNLGKKTRLMDIYSGFTTASMSKGPRSWVNICKFVSENGITHLYLPILDVSAFTRTAEQLLDPRTALSTGGTRIPWPLRQRIFETMTEKLHILYGLTELYMISIARPGEHDERETVGKPQESVTVEIVNEAGDVLAQGETGEIRVRADGMINCYFDDPIETANKFREGWFYPGDLGSLTEDGHLIIHGRVDDMMIMNGINIYPGEIERAFDTHPEIVTAAAFPVKSKIHGEIPVVALELTKGSQLTERELLIYAKEKLGVRGPRKIMLVESLPRNALGKVLKTELAAGLNRTEPRSKK